MELLKISDFYRGTVDRMFHAQGVVPPVILFDPKLSAMGSRHVQLFARISDHKASRPGGPIPRSAFRLEDLMMSRPIALGSSLTIKRTSWPLVEQVHVQGWLSVARGEARAFPVARSLSRV